MVQDGSVLSVGYEGRSLDDLTAVLKEHDVRRVIDIREKPFSRRKEFRKEVLRSHLEAVGIMYQHIRQAGNPHRKASKNIDHCLNLYRQHLQQNPEIVQLIGDQIGQDNIAMLCYERKHLMCHRSVLIEALDQVGFDFEIVIFE